VGLALDGNHGEREIVEDFRSGLESQVFGLDAFEEHCVVGRPEVEGSVEPY
jgi:hypothetical protein